MSSNPKTILVVEDQDDLRRILHLALKSAGYRVLEANNGADGVALALSASPDLILMDIQLPVLDGYEAIRRIRAEDGMAGVPIIAVSSFAMKGDEEKARTAGCDVYVSKPYSPMQLLGRVRNILDKS